MKANKRTRRDARRLYRACLVDGLLDESRVRLVVKRVADARQRRSLAILSHFERLVKLDLALHRAIIESATPLPPDLAATVQAGVTERYGVGLDVSFLDNATLIGGTRVKVGSDVYDGSVRAALAALRGRF